MDGTVNGNDRRPARVRSGGTRDGVTQGYACCQHETICGRIAEDPVGLYVLFTMKNQGELQMDVILVVALGAYNDDWIVHVKVIGFVYSEATWEAISCIHVDAPLYLMSQLRNLKLFKHTRSSLWSKYGINNRSGSFFWVRGFGLWGGILLHRFREFTRLLRTGNSSSAAVKW